MSLPSCHSQKEDGAVCPISLKDIGDLEGIKVHCSLPTPCQSWLRHLCGATCPMLGNRPSLTDERPHGTCMPFGVPPPTLEGPGINTQDPRHCNTAVFVFFRQMCQKIVGSRAAAAQFAHFHVANSCAVIKASCPMEGSRTEIPFCSGGKTTSHRHTTAFRSPTCATLVSQLRGGGSPHTAYTSSRNANRNPRTPGLSFIASRVLCNRNLKNNGNEEVTLFAALALRVFSTRLIVPEDRGEFFVESTKR